MGTEHPEYQARVAEVAERARTAKKRPIAAPGILALALVLATLPSESRAQRAAAITGNWATRGFGSIVQFRPCGASSETMCGRIVWLWEPNDGNGRPRTDNHNPDRTLRTRSLVGVEIVRGLRETEPGVWSEGALYNPDDGRTYSGTLRLNNGVLELRGCAMSVFCQTQLWRRPEEVLAQVRGL
jgi:uncharacterized protein (DUF2147 family)